MLRSLGHAIGGWLGVRNDITSPQDMEKVLANYGRGSDAGVPVTSETVAGIPVAHRCIRFLSETVSQLPIRVMTVAAGKRTPAPEHPAARVLRNPNPWQRPFEFRELLMDDALKSGAGTALITRGTGDRPVQMIRLHPAHTRIELNDRQVPQWVWRNPQTGRETTFPQSRIFHVRGPSDDGVRGLSPVAQFRNAFGEARAVQQHAGRFFANGAKPSAVVTTAPGTDVGPESRRGLREDMEELYSGANAYHTAVLPYGMTFEPTSMNHKDAQFIESRKFGLLDICRIYGVPPHLVYDLERATFSNITEQSLEVLKFSIAPWLIRWEQAIEFSLVPERDRDRMQVKHNVDALLRGDPKARAESLNIQRRAGVISANEWRRLENLDPRTDDGGNRYIIESNMQSDSGVLMSDQTGEPQP
ncbi:MAG: phage portal protein [Minwuia sp.]|nr:phage portal protein [Minwuia sp.]